MRRKRRLKSWVIPSFITIFLAAFPTAYAFYFSTYQSSIVSKFIFNQKLENTYVRATVLTYWLDLKSCENENDFKTCDLSGKSSWSITESAINPKWHKLEDGYYYYDESVKSDTLNKSNIATSSIALIDSTLTLEQITNEHLAGTNVMPQYEIIYELIDESSVEASWKVSYQNGEPTKIN